MAWSHERRTQDCLDAAREIGLKEAAEIYEKTNYAKWGVVAGLRTSPKKFREYMARRTAEDLRAKHGR